MAKKRAAPLQKLFSTRALSFTSVMAAYLVLQSLLIAARVSPARDSARYMTFALRMEAEPWNDVIRSSVDHPGYPFYLYLLFSLGKLLGIDSPPSRVLLAQAGTAAAGLAFVVIAFRLAKSLWGLLPAWAGMLAFVLLPRPAWSSSDILSDPLYAALWISSIALVIKGLMSGETRSFLLAGVAGAMAYWVRVDALTLPVTVLGACVFLALVRTGPPWSSGKSALAGTLFILGFGAGLALFVAIEGKLSGKPAAGLILGLRPTAGGLPFCLMIASPEGASALVGALWELLSDLSQEVQLVHLVTASLALGVLCRGGRLRPAAVPLALSALTYAAVLVLVKIRFQYLTGRYLLTLIPLIVCFGMHGVLEAARQASLAASPSFLLGEGRLIRALRRAWMRPSSYVLLALAISLAASLPSLLRHRPHGNFLGVILAGEWAGSTLASGDTIHDRYFFPTYLAGLESQVVKTVTPPPGGGKHYVIAQDADLEKLPELRELIRDGRAIAVQSFPRESMSKQRDVRVYEVTRGK